jgi:hypothetical protein
LPPPLSLSSLSSHIIFATCPNLPTFPTRALPLRSDTLFPPLGRGSSKGCIHGVQSRPARCSWADFGHHLAVIPRRGVRTGPDTAVDLAGWQSVFAVVGATHGLPCSGPRVFAGRGQVHDFHGSDACSSNMRLKAFLTVQAFRGHPNPCTRGRRLACQADPRELVSRRHALGASSRASEPTPPTHGMLRFMLTIGCAWLVHPPSMSYLCQAAKFNGEADGESGRILLLSIECATHILNRIVTKCFRCTCD